MWEGAKSWASLIVGLVVLALGAIPMAADLGIIGWVIPQPPEMILLIVLAIAAFYLAIDGFMELLINPGIGYASIALGIIVGTASVLKALNMFSVILTYFADTVLNIVFFIIGALLIIGAFMF
jgi:hypothetical protein